MKPPPYAIIFPLILLPPLEVQIFFSGRCY